MRGVSQRDLWEDSMGGYGCYLVRWGRRESLIMASDWAGFSWREWVGLREVNRAYLSQVNFLIL